MCCLLVVRASFISKPWERQSLCLIGSSAIYGCHRLELSASRRGDDINASTIRLEFSKWEVLGRYFPATSGVAQSCTPRMNILMWQLIKAKSFDETHPTDVTLGEIEIRNPLQSGNLGSTQASLKSLQSALILRKDDLAG